MESMIPEELLDILSCPECLGALAPEGPGLECLGCGRRFEVRGGIPVLYPDDVDLSHVAEEEKLGELMEKHVPSGRELFHEEQWERSKKEYWDYVEERLGPGTERTILNAGCGIDTRFLSIGGGGDRLVAFDLMPSLLETMRDRHGSRMNVAGTVEALPFRAESLDCICCVDLVHHEPDMLEAIVSSFHRLLKPEGLLMLEDINAWGLFQAWKSVLLPRRLHGTLRELYHDLRGSGHRPARYEFPTSVFRVRRILEGSGFEKVTALPLYSYPNAGRLACSLYAAASEWTRVARYHDFHYLLQAEKGPAGP